MSFNIYKLVHSDLGVVYVGKTKNTLERRKCGNYKGTAVEHIAKECSIELIEETNDDTRERFWIEQLRKDNNLLNKKGGDGFEVSEWRNGNQNYLDYQKSWYKENKDYNKNYYQKNKQRIDNKNKENAEKNKEQRKEYMREYYLKNKKKKHE
jgi:hypothetical protein